MLYLKKAKRVLTLFAFFYAKLGIFLGVVNIFNMVSIPHLKEVEVVYKLNELIDVPVLQKLMEQLYDAFDLPNAVIDTEGNVLIAAGWKRICTDFYRRNPITERLCIKSDAIIFEKNRQSSEPYLYECANGLVDCAIPIIIGDEHLGNFFIGQFLFEKADKAKFIERANLYGFNQVKFLEALDEVPIISKKEIKTRLKFVKNLAEVFAEQGLQKLHLLDLNRELEIAKSEAINANQSKSEFFARMSHEVRTPMNAILGLSRLLEQSQLDNTQSNYVDLITKSANALLGIINDILDFSKMEVGKLQIVDSEFNLVGLLEDVVELISYQNSDKKLELNLDVAFDTPIKIVSDELRVRQILSNLLSNAFKFTKHGNIVVRTKPIYQKDENLYIQYIVEDSGIGMNNDQINKLATPFDQGDPYITREFGGTGLGLSICYHLVELLNGTIEVTSERDKGTTFVVTLPCTISEQSAVTIKQAFSSNILTGTKALLLDDNDIALEVLASQLKSMDIDITITTSVSESIELLKSHNYDILFVDYMMPEMNGIEFIKYISEYNLIHESKCILVSGFSNNQVSEKAMNSGYVSVLEKPVLPSKLYNNILHVLDIKDSVKLKELVLSQKSVDFMKNRILVVEDNDINQLLDFELLTSMNLDLDFANNGLEAIEMYKTNDYSLVLMDVQMPIMDGYTATKIIRDFEKTINKYTPIIALTAHALVDEHKLGLDIGMNGYVTKPMNPNALVEELVKYLPYRSLADDNKTMMSQHDFLKDLDVDIDIQSALNRINNNEKLYLDLLKRFINTYNGIFISETSDLIKQHAFESLESVIHKLKGTAGNLALNQVHEEAIRLEKLLKCNQSIEHSDFQTIFGLILDIEGNVNEFITALNINNHDNLRSETSKTNTHIDNINSVDINVNELFQELLKHVKGHKPKESKELINYLYNHESYNQDHQIMKIKENIQSYDFTRAEKIITNYLNKEG